MAQEPAGADDMSFHPSCVGNVPVMFCSVCKRFAEGTDSHAQYPHRSRRLALRLLLPRNARAALLTRALLLAQGSDRTRHGRGRVGLHPGHLWTRGPIRIQTLLAAVMLA